MNYTEKSNLFNSWASTYEKDLLRYKFQYPFAGYFEIIAEIKRSLSNSMKILDVGIGSGFMLDKIVSDFDTMDCYGIDFSTEMLEIAASRFSNSQLINFNISDGVPKEIVESTFDVILSAYVLHHFSNEEKIKIIDNYFQLLSETGVFIVADIVFDSIEQMNSVKQKVKNRWDSEEENGYIIKDSFQEDLNRLGCNYKYIKSSYCSGIFIVEKIKQ